MDKQKNIKKWATLHRGLGNHNRLHILQLLKNRGPLSVSDLAKELSISFKNTSRNLNILTNLSLVVFQGKQGKVYYSLNVGIPSEVRRIIYISLS